MFMHVVTLVTLAVFWVVFGLFFNHGTRISRMNENGTQTWDLLQMGLGTMN